MLVFRQTTVLVQSPFYSKALASLRHLLTTIPNVESRVTISPVFMGPTMGRGSLPQRERLVPHTASLGEEEKSEIYGEFPPSVSCLHITIK